MGWPSFPALGVSSLSKVMGARPMPSDDGMSAKRTLQANTVGRVSERYFTHHAIARMRWGRTLVSILKGNITSTE